MYCLQLMPETLFLTVNLIDRFLALKQVTRRNLQLVRGGMVPAYELLFDACNQMDMLTRSQALVPMLSACTVHVLVELTGDALL